jgi:hypothetical protein
MKLFAQPTGRPHHWLTAESESTDGEEERGREAEKQERPPGAGGQEAADGHHRREPHQGRQDRRDRGRP